MLWCCTGAAPATVTEVLQSVLELERLPPQQDILKAAAAAADTPDQEHYDKAHLKTGPRSGTKNSQQQQQQQGKSQGKPERGSSSSGGGGSSSRVIPATEAPNVSAAVLHKLRLLRMAPFKAVRRGDWFCGVCGAHNFRANLTCVGCGVPVGSLGNSTVSAAEEDQLEKVKMSLLSD